MAYSIIHIAEAMLHHMHRRNLTNQKDLMERFRGKIDNQGFAQVMQILGEKGYISYNRMIDGITFKNIKVLTPGMEVAEGRRVFVSSNSGQSRINNYGQIGVANTGNIEQISGNINQKMQIFGQHINLFKKSIENDSEIDDKLKQSASIILDEIKNETEKKESNVGKVKDAFSKLNSIIPKYAPIAMTLLEIYMKMQGIAL